MKTSNGEWQLWERETIYDPESKKPYIKRIRIIKTPMFSIFYHRFYLPDKDRALHDHPWNFATVLLTGSYSETIKTHPYAGPKDFARHSPGIYFHPSKHFHRINTLLGTVRTLVFIGAKHKNWGFLENNKWVHHSDYERDKINQ